MLEVCVGNPGKVKRDQDCMEWKCPSLRKLQSHCNGNGSPMGAFAHLKHSEDYCTAIDKYTKHISFLHLAARSQRLSCSQHVAFPHFPDKWREIKPLQHIARYAAGFLFMCR